MASRQISLPELSLQAEVVETLVQLVDLGLLALQVRAVLLEAAGQQAGALLGCLQVLLYCLEEGLLGLQLRGHGLWDGEADRGRCGQSSQHCSRRFGEEGEAWAWEGLGALPLSFCSNLVAISAVFHFVTMNKTWKNYLLKTLRQAARALWCCTGDCSGWLLSPTVRTQRRLCSQSPFPRSEVRVSAHSQDFVNWCMNKEPSSGSQI